MKYETDCDWLHLKDNSYIDDFIFEFSLELSKVLFLLVLIEIAILSKRGK